MCRLQSVSGRVRLSTKGAKMKEREALMDALIDAGVGSPRAVRLVDEFATAIKAETAKETASRPPEWQRGTPGHPENGMGM